MDLNVLDVNKGNFQQTFNPMKYGGGLYEPDLLKSCLRPPCGQIEWGYY